MNNIDESVIIGQNVQLGNNVTIKAGCILEDNIVIGNNVYIDFFTIIHSNVTLDENSTIGARCILGEYIADFYTDRKNKVHPLHIGKGSVIRSETIIYGDNDFGDYLQTGHRVTIREKARIGEHVRIGTLSDIQGYCEIQDYVNMHSNVHIGMHSVVKKYAWIFPYAVLTNDPNPPSDSLMGVEAQGKIILCSDSTWAVREGGCFCTPRARISKDQGMSQYFNADDCPLNWTTPVFLPDASWAHPDHTTAVGEFGSRLEIHPLAPPGIAVESPAPLPFARGRITSLPNWTQVAFEETDCDGMETYAANTFLFCEADEELPVRLYSDDPLKFFCNNRLVLSARETMGGEVTLPLRSGWNRLLLIQNPSRHSMGLVMLLPAVYEFGGEREFWFSREPDSGASEGWNTVGPLKLSLEEATPSLKFERLRVKGYSSSLPELTDPYALLNASRFEPESCDAGEDEAALAWSRPLQTNDYVIYKLDMIRYGFVRVTLEATAGDLVDITIGCRRTETGFITPGKDTRGTGTIRCRNARNVYLTFVPNDCFYIMISIRRAAGSVKVLGVGFDELTRAERQETVFHCSDELLNRFWEIGRQTLRRSAAFVPLAESRADNDCYMLDAYIDAVNMAAVFGDYEYANARLQRFFREHDRTCVYAIDGTPVDETVLHPVGFIAATAEGSLAAMHSQEPDALDNAIRWVRLLWDTPIRTGTRRYYDNFLYAFAFLALAGEYRTW